MRRQGTSNGSKGQREERADGNEGAYDRSNVALLDPHGYLYKEISCTPRLTLIKRVPTRRGSRKIRVLMSLPYKERPSLPRNKCQLYATIKTPKPSQTKVRIIYPSSGTLEWWKFFFFIAQVLSRAHEDCMTYWWFLASSALIPISLVQEPCIHRIIPKKNYNKKIPTSLTFGPWMIMVEEKKKKIR